MVSKTTSNITRHLKSGAAANLPLFSDSSYNHSLNSTLTDLQRSRTLSARQTPVTSPSHTRYRPSQYGFCGYKTGSANTSPSHTYLIGSHDVMQLSLERLRTHTPAEDVEGKATVQELRNFYETLTRRAELEESLNSSCRSATRRDSTLRRGKV